MDITNKTSGDIYIQSNKNLTLIDLNNEQKAFKNAGGGIFQSSKSIEIKNAIAQGADFSLIARSTVSISGQIQHQGLTYQSN